MKCGLPAIRTTCPRSTCANDLTVPPAPPERHSQTFSFKTTAGFVTNLEDAKALDLEVPSILLAPADEVVE